MSNDYIHSRRLLQGLGANANENSHPGLDLLLYVMEYVVQLLSVYSSCPLMIAAENNANTVSTSMFTLLLSTGLLATEFATDAFDNDAISAPRFSALSNAFWGLAIMAFANFLLFILLACLEVSGVVFSIAWVFCLVSSLIAPACLIKYQFDLFIARHDHRSGNKGGRS